mmetsp:Transcript_80393/g.260494  ORF Transcript_80393/g.260494 Transcript_80393/m.260494 type:complete len:90 (+) Transcript_80393:1957-2226(+)
MFAYLQDFSLHLCGMLPAAVQLVLLLSCAPPCLILKQQRLGEAGIQFFHLLPLCPSRCRQLMELPPQSIYVVLICTSERTRLFCGVGPR